MIKKITKILEQLFPDNNQNLDNNGFNFKFEDIPNNKVAIALDLTLDILKKIIKENIKLIILHHPLIFQEYKEELKNSLKKEIFSLIIKHKINCYVIHTNYNSSKFGDNKKCLELLKCSNIKLISKNTVSYIGKNSKNYNIKELILKLKQIYNLEYVQLIKNNNQDIKKIIICAGSGNSISSDLFKNNTLFITGELKWSKCIEFVQRDINVIILGHYMEMFFVENIKKIFENKLNLEIYAFNINNILKCVI